VPDYSSEQFSALCSEAKSVFPVSTNTIIECCGGVSEKMAEKFLIPDCSLFKKINDKYSLCAIAEKAGVDYPETFAVSDESDLLQAVGHLSFPVVLKLANDEGLFLAPDQRYAIVEKKEELYDSFTNLKKFGKKIILQNYINGVGVGFSVLYDRSGKCIISFQHQRLREYPISGGPSTYCKSVHYDIIEEKGRKLMDCIKWRGPAMVEFKYDPDSRKLVLIEINPRYWGSLPLARKAGINIPLVHFHKITGEPFEYTTDYRDDVKLKFLASDFVAAVNQIKADNTYFSGPFAYCSEFFRSKTSFGILELNDLKPAVHYFTSRFFSGAGG
jgi:predicted ATP-grasp superfamily ATP-dependent carboligase